MEASFSLSLKEDYFSSFLSSFFGAAFLAGAFFLAAGFFSATFALASFFGASSVDASLEVVFSSTTTASSTTGVASSADTVSVAVAYAGLSVFLPLRVRLEPDLVLTFEDLASSIASLKSTSSIMHI